MRIGIDLVSTENKDGTGTFSSNLVHNLEKIPDVELSFYAEDNSMQTFLEKSIWRALKKIIRFTTQTSIDPFYEWFILPKIINLDRLDIYHAIGSIVPKKSTSITIQTCLDLAYYYHTDYLPSSLIRYYTKWVKVSAQNANHVVAISESTKKDIIKFWKIPENKITVIYLGVDKNTYSKRVLSKNEFQNITGMKGEYILSVGNLNPRKNSIRLMKAFSKIADRVPLLKLVFIGSSGKDEKSLRILAGSLGLEEKIIFAGRVSKELLIAYYQNSRAFCYPSLYEGFGLPILEAMAAGTPVLTSNTSSMSEVAGNAAVLVNPLDISSISGGILNVLERKDELVIKGAEQVKKFTWERTASETYSLYERLMREKLHASLKSGLF